MNGYKIVLLKAIFMLYRLPECERVCSGICILPSLLIFEVMRTVDVTPKKQNDEGCTRKIRCVSSPRSTYNRRLPSISLAGVWLKKAGFEVGDFARITVADGVLVISSERLPDNENREK